MTPKQLKQVMETLETQETLQVNRETTRDIYSYCGVWFFHDVTLPWNVFKPQSEKLYIDRVMTKNDAEQVAKRHNGKAVEVIYGEDDQFTVEFHGKKCFEQALTYIQRRWEE